ncbi:MAG: hypothetical protein EOO73_25640 [Myxococcales bacterium]|nr:MAG: hypothetical protein EOO73_25640 [Myxococcales bacterium]
MNRFLALLGASTLGVCFAAACSDSEAQAPAGVAGESAGGSASGGAAGSSSAGNAGAGNPTGGGSVGGVAPVGGAATSGSGGAAEGGGAGAPGLPRGEAVIGQRCPVASTIGVVQLAGFPEPYVQVTLYDRKDPWLSAPELVNETCEYHHYTPGVCAGCGAGEVCSVADECVPEPRTVKNAKLIVSTGSLQRELHADPQLGGIYSMLDIGDEAAKYAMTLSWGETEVTLAPMAVGSGDIAELAVDIEGDSSAPGALDATWEPSEQGGFVRTRIPMNHHAAGPSFTECAAPESAGAFHADAEMVDPLAVVTGLEFQGVEHSFIAAAETEQGCVEFRFGPQLLVLPD